MEKKIIRLEQALKVWEDTCFLSAKNYTFAPKEYRDSLGLSDKTGPLIHHSELRQHIIKDCLAGKFDYDRFVGTTKGVLLGISSVPQHLFAWNHYSRRVYHLDRNMQTLLSATSLDGVYHREIKWPFQSFVLTLEEPLHDDKGRLFDCIVVSDISQTEDDPEIKNNYQIFEFLLLSTELDRYKPIDRKKFEKRFSQGKISNKEIARKIRHTRTHFIESFFTFLRHGSKKDFLVTEPTKEHLREYIEKTKKHTQENSEETEVVSSEEIDEYNLSYSLYDKAQHLVLSTCMFLSTLPPKTFSGENEPSKEKEAATAYSLTSISKPEKIFYVQCESVLSKETQETIAAIKHSRIGREKKPHWRRGHWRKIWGGKDTPSAPKIWILPCLINKHRLPPNSLPIASKTTLE